MFEKLAAHTQELGQDAVQRTIDRLVRSPPPPGVQVEASPDGIVLSGKRLRRRMIDDPQLRNFGR